MGREAGHPRVVSPGIFYEQLLIDILCINTTVRREPNMFVASKILLSSLVTHCVIATYDTHLVLFLIDFFS